MVYVCKNKSNKQKMVVQAALVAVFLCVIIFVLIPLTSAGLKETLIETFENALASMFGTYSSEVAKIFDLDNGLWRFFGEAGNTVTAEVKNVNIGFIGGSTLDVPVVEVKKVDQSAINMTALGTTFFSGMAKAIRGIAAGLFTIKIFTEIIQAASEDRVNLDFVLKMGCKIGIVFVIIGNIDTLLTAIHTYFSWAIDSVSDAATKTLAEQSSGLAGYLTNLLTENNLVSGIGFIRIFIAILWTRLLGMILFPIIMLLVKIGAYALMIELGLRRVLMPIALLGFLDIGPRSAGMRFIKKYVAVYFKMMIYILAFALSDSLGASHFLSQYAPMNGDKVDFDNGTSTYWDEHAQTLDGFMDSVFGACGLEYAALSIAAFIFARKGDSLAEEVVGANSG